MSNQIREKLEEHMQLHGLTQETRRGYISGVRCLANHYQLSPDHITDNQVRNYFQHPLMEFRPAGR